MSTPQGRGGTIRKRNADEANLSPEELMKKQKNREAARKHREKKEKNMKELETKNKQYEAQISQLRKEQEQLLACMEKNLLVIKKHKEMGCSLPTELEKQLEMYANLGTSTITASTWSDATDTIRPSSNGSCSSMSPMSIDQSVSSHSRCISSYQSVSSCSPTVESCRSSASTPDTNAAPAENDEQAGNPRNPAVALFSGAPLLVSKQQGRHHVPVSTPHRQHRSVTQIEQSPRLTATDMAQRKGAVTVQKAPAQNQVPAPIPTGRQSVCRDLQVVPGQETPKEQQETALDTSESNAQLQGTGRADVFQSLPDGGRRQILIQDKNGNIHLIDRQTLISQQIVNASEKFLNPPQFQRAQSPMLIQTKETMRGNIPAAELLGNFEQPLVRTATPSDNGNGDVSLSVPPKEDTLLTSTEQPVYDYFDDLPTYRCQQVDSTEIYSYTNDLNQSENPQSILHLLQEQVQTLPHVNSEDASHLLSQNCTHSPAAPQEIDEESTTLRVPICSGAEITNANCFRPIMNNCVPGTVGLEASQELLATTSGDVPVNSGCVQGSMTCAPAILDMLSESRLAPLLQDQIKASLSLPTFVTNPTVSEPDQVSVFSNAVGDLGENLAASTLMSAHLSAPGTVEASGSGGYHAAASSFGGITLNQGPGQLAGPLNNMPVPTRGFATVISQPNLGTNPVSHALTTIRTPFTGEDVRFLMSRVFR